MDNLPEKLRERFGSLEADGDLIDGCKYVLCFAEGYEWNGYSSVPVRSKKEAVEFLRGAVRVD